MVGFSGKEKERIVTHLHRLLPYLKPDKFVIVGGLAIRYHLLSHGIDYPHRPFNDLDIIVKDRSVVSPSVASDFLVCHYHPQDNYLALVDPVSKTKVDVFSYCPAPQRTFKVDFNGRKIDIVSVEDQLVKSVLDVQRISAEAKVDPKQFSDMRLLMQIADMEKTNKIWRLNDFDKWPKSIKEAINRVEAIAREHPEWLQEKPFRRPQPYICPNCQSKDGFEIVPMEEVYQVLGYIE